MAPRGVVKMVLDGLIDTLNMNINKGFSVQLGDFGCFRPGLNAKSQDKEEDVKSATVYRRKIIFTPGQQFKEMLTRYWWKWGRGRKSAGIICLRIS